MEQVFPHFDSEHQPIRGYEGLFLEEAECREKLKGPVSDQLQDREEQEDFRDALERLQTETGFTSENLMADIQALEDENVDEEAWRIGEAFTEVVLGEEFQCRFHWNELRDARNSAGSKHGADLVGFIEVGGQVLFLFGEVKTSSETNNRPPQVMTNAEGMENQLRDLYNDYNKRRDLIKYLRNKANLFPEDHPFKEDFDAGIRSYYTSNGNYQLIGVLVRDVEPNEDDIRESYERLRTEILDPTGLKLLALYLPVTKEHWLPIINEDQE